MTRKWTPANEVLAELEHDPAYRERQRELRERKEENRRRYDDAAVGVIGDLAAAGYRVAAMGELRQVGDKGVIPIIAAWLPRVDYLPLKQDMLAALGSRWARPEAARVLVDAFRRADPAADDPTWGVRWSAGNSLLYVADESVVDDLIHIARDDRHGVARTLVVAALGNMRRAKQKVLPVLLELLDTGDDVRVGALMALAKLKAPESRPAVERDLTHPNPEVRRLAKKALSRLPAK